MFGEGDGESEKDVEDFESIRISDYRSKGVMGTKPSQSR